MGLFLFVASLVACPFSTTWGSPYKRRVQDHPVLQLLEKEMVKRVAKTVVPPLENLLLEELLVTLYRKDPPSTSKCFSWLYLG